MDGTNTDERTTERGGVEWEAQQLQGGADSHVRKYPPPLLAPDSREGHTSVFY